MLRILLSPNFRQNSLVSVVLCNFVARPTKDNKVLRESVVDCHLPGILSSSHLTFYPLMISINYIAMNNNGLICINQPAGSSHDPEL